MVCIATSSAAVEGPSSTDATAAEEEEEAGAAPAGAGAFITRATAAGGAIRLGNTREAEVEDSGDGSGEDWGPPMLWLLRL